jgi:hypothetical protein
VIWQGWSAKTGHVEWDRLSNVTYLADLMYPRKEVVGCLADTGDNHITWAH